MFASVNKNAHTRKLFDMEAARCACERGVNAYLRGALELEQGALSEALIHLKRSAAWI